MPDSAALRAHLRQHVNGWPGYRGCSDCDPAAGRYCAAILPVAEAFYAVRRGEVLCARLERVERCA
jgi:hypothetical protein